MKFRKIFFIILALFFSTHFSFAQSEQLTFTSYYPSPFGAYDRVRFVPRNTLPNADCNNSTVGLAYYDITDDNFKICHNIGGVSQWLNITGNNNIWAQTGNFIYPAETSTNPNIRVGINTTTPQAAFDVNGQVLVSNGNSLDVTGPLTVDAADPFVIFHDTNSGATYNRMYLIGRDGNLSFQSTNENLTAWAPTLLTLDSVNNQTIFPNGRVGVNTAAPQGTLHVNNLTGFLNHPAIVVESNGATNTTPRIGLVDTRLGPVAAAPAWFIDNKTDSFRVFRQPNLTAPGNEFLSINPAGTVTIPNCLNLGGSTNCSWPGLRFLGRTGAVTVGHNWTPVYNVVAANGGVWPQVAFAVITWYSEEHGDAPYQYGALYNYGTGNIEAFMRGDSIGPGDGQIQFDILVYP